MKIVWKIWNLLVWRLFVYTGTPIAIVIGLFKTMGDGSGNESGMIEGFQWACYSGIVIWIGVIASLGYWLTIHFFK